MTIFMKGKKMKTLMSNIGWIIAALLFAFAFMGALRYAAGRYKRVPPSKVGILFGRKRVYKVLQADGSEREEKLGFRLLTGGGALVIPICEEYTELDLSARGIQVKVEKIPNIDGVPITVEGLATVSIGTEETNLISAARNFGGKTDEEIEKLIQQNLEGQLRAIVGTLTIEQIITDREQLNKAVLRGAEEELLKLGVKIQILTIQNITDEKGYIDNLGKGKTAEVKRNATIKEAEADRDAKIASSNALKEAEMVSAQNAIKIAEAQKVRDVQIATFKKETDTERAKADLAGALATAQMDKSVRQARVEAEATETESRIDLAEKEALRKEKELVSTIIK